jgi:hypothetical protein
VTTFDKAAVDVGGRGEDKPFNWAKAAVVSAIVAGATVFFLATGRRGAAGDPRRVNPTPIAAFQANGVPRGEPPMWGFQYWPEFFGIIMVVIAVLVMAPFVIQSVRQRKLVHPLIVFLGTAILAWLDPLANWVTYTNYNPQLIHFPTTWPWMELSPTVEPLLVIPGYPFYYFTIALIAFGGYGRYILRRVAPDSWWWRHPRIGAFIVGFGVATLWDVPTELFMINARMYTYSQYWGPTVSVGGAHVALPLVWSLFTIVSIATITVLLYRDDTGESVLTTLGRKVPKLGATTRRASREVSSGRQVLAAAVVLSMVYILLCGFYGTLRVTGLAHKHNMPNPYVYQEVKTYDPDGVLRESGYQGPFFESCCSSDGH